MTTEARKKVEATRKGQTWQWLVANLFSILAAALGSLVPLADIGEREPLLFYVVGAFMILLVITTTVATYMKKGSAKASALRDNLSKAFLESLDKSALNPKGHGGLSNG